MDHDHALQFLAALFTVGAVGYVGYQFGKDHEQNRCADALLGLGLLAVEGQVEQLQYPQPYAELPVSWGSSSPAGCGCG
ncbi:MAG: hypothetical protein ABSD62_12065 [Candidatus Limnocylindrales bacterium]|jgi:hypothetical protein